MRAAEADRDQARQEAADAQAARAKHQADDYRAELDRLRAGSHDPDPEPPVKTARRGTRGQAAQPRTATDQ